MTVINYSEISEKIQNCVSRLVALENEKSRMDEEISALYREIKHQKFDAKRIRQAVSLHRKGHSDREIGMLLNTVVTDHIRR
ncbi:MAG: GapR family DNA-binding domain-containing protein [Zymomonas mobilis]